MEGRELRRLRLAHGLTVSQLAIMVNVSADDIYQWEAPAEAKHAVPMSSTMRQQIIRQLALHRDREELVRSLIQPRVVPTGFRPGHLLPSMVRVK